MGTIAIIGGTGPEGVGLALRFALVGEAIRIGSRQADRAAAAAARATEQLSGVGCCTRVSGHENTAALEGADMAVLALPYTSVHALLPQLAPRLVGKMVLDVVNAVVRDGGVFRVANPGNSAGEEIQHGLPQAQVVSAFKTLSAQELLRIPQPLAGDVVVCSDHPEARARICALVSRISALRPVDAGGLVNARSLEAITALLLNLNRRYRTLTSIQILGLDGRTVGSRQ